MQGHVHALSRSACDVVYQPPRVLDFACQDKLVVEKSARLALCLRGRGRAAKELRLK